jgi:two-component system response regulator
MKQTDSTVPGTVVMADDDRDDCDLVVDAWRDVRAGVDITCVYNGQQLLDLLEGMADEREGLPAVVLLDLNMPMVDGWAALAALKQNPRLRRIPIVVFTTSAVEDHVDTAYDMQAAGFVTKPTSYRGLVNVIAGIDRYWLATVTTPNQAPLGEKNVSTV